MEDVSIVYRFTSCSRIFHLYGDVTIAGEVLFRPMHGPQGLFCVTPAVTRGHGFSCLIRRIDPFSRLLRHTSGYGGPFLTRILTSTMEDHSYTNLPTNQITEGTLLLKEHDFIELLKAHNFVIKVKEMRHRIPEGTSFCHRIIEGTLLTEETSLQ
jgi:hypothetical protein